MSKKENIIKSALELFSQNGFSKTSTKEISKHAKVSEGLIFKHFVNKESLFTSVKEKVEAKIQEKIEPILIEEEPIKVIRKMLELAFEISDDELSFWRFYYRSKWENNFNDLTKNAALTSKITSAFKYLGFQDAEKETGILILIVNGIAENIVREGKINQLQFKYFLIHKYTL